MEKSLLFHTHKRREKRFSSFRTSRQKWHILSRLFAAASLHLPKEKRPENPHEKCGNLRVSHREKNPRFRIPCFCYHNTIFRIVAFPWNLYCHCWQKGLWVIKVRFLSAFVSRANEMREIHCLLNISTLTFEGSFLCFQIFTPFFNSVSNPMSFNILYYKVYVPRQMYLPKCV